VRCLPHAAPAVYRLLRCRPSDGREGQGVLPEVYRLGLLQGHPGFRVECNVLPLHPHPREEPPVELPAVRLVLPQQRAPELPQDGGDPGVRHVQPQVVVVPRGVLQPVLDEAVGLRVSEEERARSWEGCTLPRDGGGQGPDHRLVEGHEAVRHEAGLVREDLAQGVVLRLEEHEVVQAVEPGLERPDPPGALWQLLGVEDVEALEGHSGEVQVVDGLQAPQSVQVVADEQVQAPRVVVVALGLARRAAPRVGEGLEHAVDVQRGPGEQQDGPAVAGQHRVVQSPLLECLQAGVQVVGDQRPQHALRALRQGALRWQLDSSLVAYLGEYAPLGYHGRLEDLPEQPEAVPDVVAQRAAGGGALEVDDAGLQGAPLVLQPLQQLLVPHERLRRVPQGLVVLAVVVRHCFRDDLDQRPGLVRLLALAQGGIHSLLGLLYDVALGPPQLLLLLQERLALLVLIPCEPGQRLVKRRGL
jgi:hypothetical protein